MNQRELKKQRERLIDWLEMLSIIPDESPSGVIRDAYWQGALESGLTAVERRLDINRGEKCANALLSITNELRRLKYLGNVHLF